MNRRRNTQRLRAPVLLAALLLAGSAGAGAPLRDPTVPSTLGVSGATADAHVGRWQLTSTLVGPHRRFAVINGNTVAQGERLDGARILTIGDGEVRVRSHGRTVTLRVLPGTAVRKQRSRTQP
ncbi:MAG TPA: hypothetical protein VKA76_16280 [Gammaproteobacteria bacterium]|nr:hypothetical protein [Gammaproteobacteria bacterium]